MKIRQKIVSFGLLVAGCVIVTTLSSVPVAFAQTTLTGDAKAGQTKAAVCAACHGPNGVSVNPLWPSLAGQQERYLVNQIKTFRDGDRVEVTMQPFVQNLTDQDVADLAAYYNNLSPCP